MNMLATDTAYRVVGWSGIAFRLVRQPDAEHAVMVMIGDDREHVVDVDDLTPLLREEFCGECGQIGCTHDGLER